MDVLFGDLLFMILGLSFVLSPKYMQFLFIPDLNMSVLITIGLFIGTPKLIEISGMCKNKTEVAASRASYSLLLVDKN